MAQCDTESPIPIQPTSRAAGHGACAVARRAARTGRREVGRLLRHVPLPPSGRRLFRWNLNLEPPAICEMPT